MSNEDQQVPAFEKIREKVFEMIKANNQLREENILVDVEGSEVILYGDVTSEDKRWLAEDLSLYIPGVLHLSNRIQVLDQ